MAYRDIREKQGEVWVRIMCLTGDSSLFAQIILSSSKHTAFFIHLCLCPSPTVTTMTSMTYSKSNRSADVKSFFTQELSPFLYKRQDHRTVGQSF